MIPQKVFLLLTLLLMLLLVFGCNPDSLETLALQQHTPTVAVTTTTTATNTSTPLPPSSTTIKVNLNVRSGPGTNFERIGQLAPESVAQIVGKNENGSWWQIIHPDNSGQIGWISASPDYGHATQVDAVPVALIPPTPTVAPAIAMSTPPPPTALHTENVTASRTYPPVPADKSLLYVFNFHSEEMEFSFIGQPENHFIPGKRMVPEGAHLTLFVDPGFYRWSGIVQAADLRGEGEFTLVAGQIQGLGLAHGKIGPDDVVDGFLIGSDPLAPAVTPSPTPIPTPPTPSPGKSTLVVVLDRRAELTVNGQKMIIPQGQRLFLELDPGPYVIPLTYELAIPGQEFRGLTIKDHTSILHGEYQLELQPDSICDWKFWFVYEPNLSKPQGLRYDLTCRPS